MAKRITSIKVSNYRAYHGVYDFLYLPKGENLLIYGENGSGKSSLYKALKNFFDSSINTSLPFVKNRYHLNGIGEIKISFSDFTNSPLQIIENTHDEYHFGCSSFNHNVAFIQNASLVNGFLDYTDLLNVYLHKEARPNLFKLIVLSLLGDHIPVSSGGIFKFKSKWLQLQQDLIEKPYNRNDNLHKSALRDLPVYQTHLHSTLTQVFNELNRLLNEYFHDLRVQLRFDLEPIQFNYGYKSDWHTTADLRLVVIKDGIQIDGDYNDLLNEARLSAIAICLYLASLLRNPSNVDLKILYLDDVFIGLDAGNRIPILNIIKNEFSTYQIFISTYDRHWFELAKRQFEVNNDLSWATIEMYVGKDNVDGIEITKPILVKGVSNYEKAVHYLHNRSRPDYPAAANYFRKALEELIQLFIPKWELTDVDNSQLLDYQLTSLLLRTKNFLIKTNNSPVEIMKIIGLLHNLIHPLSHHEITSPIYKDELVILETSFSKLKFQLQALDIKNNFKCLLEKGKRLKITFTIDNSTNHHFYYEILLKEPLVLHRNSEGQLTLSLVSCYADKCYGTNNGTTIPSFNPKKTDQRFNYNSLEDAFEKIHSFITNTLVVRSTKASNYLVIYEYHDGTNWQPIMSRVNW